MDRQRLASTTQGNRVSAELEANKQVIVDYFNEQMVAGLGSALRYLADDAT